MKYRKWKTAKNCLSSLINVYRKVCTKKKPGKNHVNTPLSYFKTLDKS